MSRLEARLLRASMRRRRIRLRGGCAVVLSSALGVPRCPPLAALGGRRREHAYSRAPPVLGRFRVRIFLLGFARARSWALTCGEGEEEAAGGGGVLRFVFVGLKTLGRLRILASERRRPAGGADGAPHASSRRACAYLAPHSDG